MYHSVISQPKIKIYHMETYPEIIYNVKLYNININYTGILILTISEESVYERISALFIIFL